MSPTWLSRAAAGVAPVLIAGTALLPGTAAQAAPLCPDGTTPVPVTWGAPGLEWPRGVVDARVNDIGGSGLDVHVTLQDPASRNGDDSNPLADLGESAVPGWDQRVLTGTNATFGGPYLTAAMNSLRPGDALGFTIQFTHPVLVPDFTVGDIDFVGVDPASAEEPWTSHQDEVGLTASRGGAPVGVTLAGSPLGGPYLPGVDGDLDPDHPGGTLAGRTSEPVTTFRMTFSNGPDDEAAEALVTPHPALPTPAGSVSDGHAVRVSAFTACLGTGSISDVVHADVDGDGVRSAAEPGVAGAAVQLLDPDGNTVLSTTTSSDGRYSFPKLPPFAWTVRVIPPAGYPAPAPVTVPLGADEHAVVPFALRPTPGVVSGSVPGLADVAVTLQGTDFAGRAVSLSTTTLGDGSFQFSDVAAGTYTLAQTQPAGWTDGPDTAGAFGVSAGNDVFTITLPPNGSSAGTTFTELPAGVIHGRVLVDGVGLAGVPVTLTGPVSGAVTTNANGWYSFEQLPPGGYDVTETQPAGLGSRTPDSVSVALDAGEVGRVDFRDEHGSVAGVVWSDVDGDGNRDVGEAGTADAVVALLDAAGAEVAKASTDADGRYRFEGLLAGGYQVRFTAPAGHRLTTAGLRAADVLVDGIGRISRPGDLNAGLGAVGVVEEPTSGGEDLNARPTTVLHRSIPVTGVAVDRLLPLGLALLIAGAVLVRKPRLRRW